MVVGVIVPSRRRGICARASASIVASLKGTRVVCAFEADALRVAATTVSDYARSIIIHLIVIG